MPHGMGCSRPGLHGSWVCKKLKPYNDDDVKLSIQFITHGHLLENQAHSHRGPGWGQLPPKNLFFATPPPKKKIVAGYMPIANMFSVNCEGNVTFSAVIKTPTITQSGTCNNVSICYHNKNNNNNLQLVSASKKLSRLATTDHNVPTLCPKTERITQWICYRCRAVSDFCRCYDGKKTLVGSLP